MRRAFHMLVVLGISAWIWMPHTPARANGLPGVIAYTTGASKNDELHLVNPDGSADHVIWRAPSTAQFGIAGIDWRPDGGAIAFASDHEAARSFYETDLYAVDPEGQQLRRLTNGPDPSSFGAYGKGVVTVNVNVAASGGPFLVYVLGAAEPQAVTTSHMLTFTNVADLGPGVAQPVVAINGFHRWITPGVAPDVKAGETVAAGTLEVWGDGGVYRALNPAWRADGSNIGFIFGSGCGTFRQIAADPGPAELGSSLITPDFFLGYTCLLARGPTGATANQVLYSEFDIDTGHIYRTVEGSSEPGEDLVQYDPAERLLDLAWLPDGSGFVYTLTADFQQYSNIYVYRFSTATSTPVTEMSESFPFHVSLSPDSRTIAFDRAVALDGAASIWLVNIDGSNLHEIVASGAFPAWGLESISPGPPPAQAHQAYLPLVER